MNRRSFLSTVSAAGTWAALTPSGLLAGTQTKPLKVSLIGCGWFGAVDLESIRAVAPVEVIALCDPNRKNLRQLTESVSAYQKEPPALYQDFRKLLAARQSDIVIVGTPDHWHALPAIEAMKTGADVYLEKPISVDVMEGEAILAAARRYGRVVQVNLQRRTVPIVREARERYLDSGRLGRIGRVEAYYYGGANPSTIPTEQPPDYLDYDLWCGPAPVVDYISPIADKGWRRFMEYGNGFIGDMGVHMFDMVRMMLDLGWPLSVSSNGRNLFHQEATGNRPDTQMATFHYPGLDVTWEHRMWGKPPIPGRHWSDFWGARFIGENGILDVKSMSYAFMPDGTIPTEGRHVLSATGDLENVDYDNLIPKFVEIQGLHVADFLRAREQRSRPTADVLQGHISSASCILANLSMDLGRTLRYDPETREVPGDAEATQRLARPYRDSWIHPHPDRV